MNFLFLVYKSVDVRCTLAFAEANCRSHNSSTEYSVQAIVFLLASNLCGKAEAKLRVSDA